MTAIAPARLSTRGSAGAGVNGRRRVPGPLWTVVAFGGLVLCLATAGCTSSGSSGSSASSASSTSSTSSTSSASSASTDPSRAADCTPPAHEDALLDEYAHDPVFSLTPDGATPVGGLSRSKGCLRLNREDTSATSVLLRFQLSRDYDESTLREIYQPVATARGWRVDPAAAPSPRPVDDQYTVYLGYCRSISGVTSYLLVTAWRGTRMDVQPPQVTPGTLLVYLFANPGPPCVSVLR